MADQDRSKRMWSEEDLTPAQREQLRKAHKSVRDALKGIAAPRLASILPDMSEVLKGAGIGKLAESITPRFSGDIDFTDSLKLNLPKFKIDLPPLRLDYDRLFGPALNIEKLGLLNAIDVSSHDAFQKIFDRQRESFKAILDRIFDALLPPNWRGVRKLDGFETILLDEGLALAWVPPTDILEALLQASSRQERRRILGRRWKRVVRACRQLLESCADTDVLKYQQFALPIVNMLEQEHPEGAQALAANLLDTMLRESLSGADRTRFTSQRSRLSIDDLPMRAAIVFGGIWGSHTEFWQCRGDAIPRHFSRHGSAHAVSRTQYSRINAVIALMHVTAYIMLLDSGDLT